MPKKIFLILVLLTPLGCMSFSSENLNDLSTANYPKIDEKLNINFKNSSLNISKKGKRSENKEKKVLEGYMLTKSKYFVAINTLKGEEDYHFNFKTLSLATDKSFLKWAFSPFYFKTERKLEVDVIKEDRILKRYLLNDSIIHFMHLFLLNTKRNVAEVDANIIKTFLMVFYKDFLAKKPEESQAKS